MARAFEHAEAIEHRRVRDGVPADQPVLKVAAMVGIHVRLSCAKQVKKPRTVNRQLQILFGGRHLADGQAVNISIDVHLFSGKNNVPGGCDIDGFRRIALWQRLAHDVRDACHKLLAFVHWQFLLDWD